MSRIKYLGACIYAILEYLRNGRQLRYRANLKDAKLNEMIDEALVEIDPAKREQEYFEIENYLDEIVPIVPLWTSFVNIGTKAEVEGAVWMPTAKHDYRLIQIP